MAFFRRHETPPKYSDYRKYKPFLRKDFERRCAYCERTESSLGGEEQFEIDHFKPRKKSSDLRSEYQNLYYACRKCNLSKGSTWPSDEKIKSGFVFADPCLIDPYEEHFREKADGGLEKLTNCGRYTSDHIRLDRPEVCKWRQSRRQARLDMPTLRELEKELLYSLDFARSLADRDAIERRLEVLQRFIDDSRERFVILG
jgi:hypothetical protein